jgi:RHH-type proline utilization regulon transcriptional repressor/proline dehydrogenase/delta 1-pyrroline-5-carboxylate dehydrogenase
VRTLAGRQSDCEFQRLHGMGEDLYEELMNQAEVACRLYAPVGSYDDLLPYLVRRLLENGANTSFVNRLADDEAPIGDIIADPVERMRSLDPRANPRIPLPARLFPKRRNSRGFLLSDPAQAGPLLAGIARTLDGAMVAMPLIDGEGKPGGAVPVRDPADRTRQVGAVVSGTPAQVEQALAGALAAAPSWDAMGGDARATILERAADLYERDRAMLVGLCVREGGKTVSAGLAEVREAVDFLRYYALLARTEFAGPRQLPGPTGERNEWSLRGRGVFACISPWNFPVAIFTGQVAGALAAGNGVIAKPAEQTPLTAFTCTRLLHEAGVPGGVLHLVPGDGPVIGGALSRHADIAGVAFTGSTEVAQQINRALASRGGPLPTLIAETGGLNAMIADSTTLPEQLVRDVIASAFDSAGQRCSALRVLFLQKDIAPRVLKMLAGAMLELRLGDPMRLDMDIGPVIDPDARETLRSHAARMAREGRLVVEVPLPGACDAGTFFAPRAYEIDAISCLPGEVFGPILHVVRYEASRLGEVCEAINATGYGLTLGVHSRIDDTADFVRARVRVGNLYVNRTQIGAVVGSQPFGGEGLSGTGPKAGGPHYLHGFAVERVVSTNTTAAGGNASLLSLE